MSSIHSKEYRDLIARLIAARKAAGLTQVEVAEKLGKPQSYVSKIENCQRRVDVLELKNFSEIYDLHLDKIL